MSLCLCLSICMSDCLSICLFHTLSLTLSVSQTLSPPLFSHTYTDTLSSSANDLFGLLILLTAAIVWVDLKRFFFISPATPLSVSTLFVDAASEVGRAVLVEDALAVAAGSLTLLTSSKKTDETLNKYHLKNIGVFYALH